MSKPTPRPWRIEKSERGGFWIRAGDWPGLSISLIGNEAAAEANAAHIVKCVNLHEELLECIRWIAQAVHQGNHTEKDGTFESCPKNTCRHATEMLAKAKGGGE